MVKELELGKLVSAYKLLEGGADIKFSIKNLDLKFTGETALKISLLKLKLRDFETSSEETRTSLIREKYGVADETGNFSVPNDRVNDFIREYSEILSTKHTITFTPFTIKDLANIDVPVEFTDILIDFFE